jgi:predicted transcriptional regulator
MSTLRVGIATYEEMKAMTMAVARRRRRLTAADPKVWFLSTESFARVLTASNRELLRVIAEKAPGSLEEMAELTGRKKPNLSRTLKTMERYGLVRLERGERSRLIATTEYDRIELVLPLTTVSHAA